MLRSIFDPRSTQSKTLALFLSAVMVWSQVSVAPSALASEGADEAPEAAEAALTSEDEASNPVADEAADQATDAATDEAAADQGGDAIADEGGSAPEAPADEAEEPAVQPGDDGVIDGADEGVAEEPADGIVDAADSAIADIDAAAEEAVADRPEADATADVALASVEDGIMVTAIEGDHKVTVGSTITLSDDEGNVENAGWYSSNTSIATVADGVVTGVAVGSVTISHEWYSTELNKQVRNTYDVQVIAADDYQGKVAIYYLNTPGNIPGSNSEGDWGALLGYATVDLTGITWSFGDTFSNDRESGYKNAYASSDTNGNYYIVEWPDGTTGSSFVLTKATYPSHWSAIFTAFKSDIAKQLGVSASTITEDDVQAIILTPYKYSRDNGSTSNLQDYYHVDCTMTVVSTKVSYVTFNLVDAGAYGYRVIESLKVAPGTEVEPGTTNDVSSSVKATYPETKTVNGVTYKLDGWYTDAACTQKVAEFPTTVSENTDFYAKYVPANLSYTVNYYWQGTDGEKVAESKTVSGCYLNESVTESPIAISGYTVVAGATDVTIEVGLNSSSNVINFYYQKNVTLTAPNGTGEKYNGSEQTFTSDEYTSSVEGLTFEDVSSSATGKDAGTYNVTFAEGTVGTVDTTGKYVVSDVNDGTFTIAQRDVTLTSGSAEKHYNGEALTNGDVAVTGDGFVDGEGATYNVTGSQTEVGESPNTFTYELNANTKAENYNIITSEGTLTVTKSVTPAVNDPQGATYDGGSHQWTPTVTDPETGNTLVENKDYTVTYSTDDFTNAGTVTVTITGIGDYSGTVEKTYTIAPRPVTLTSASDSKTYDGQPLTNGKVTVGGQGFVAGQEPTYTVTGAQTSAGSSKNAFTYAFPEGVKAENYSITTVEGDLVVDKAGEITVVITGTTGEAVTYDGSEHTVSGYTDNAGDKPGVTVSYNGEGQPTAGGTNAGEYKMDLTESDFTVSAPDYEKVTVIVVDGGLTINKAAAITVTVTGKSATEAYDGTEKTVSGCDIVVPEGATVSVALKDGSKAEATGTNAGEYKMGLNEGSFTVTGGDNYEGVKFEITDGTLTVTPQSIDPSDEANYGGVTVEAPEDVVYNGESQQQKPVVKDKDGNVLVEGTDYDLAYSEDTTDAGTVTVTVKGKGNYSGETTVQYKIAPRPVTLTSASDSKTYDGQPLTNGKVTVSGEGFVAGQEPTYDVTGTQTSAGSSKNTFTYAFPEGVKAENYSITTVEGDLTVNKKAITIKVTGNTSSDATYDGTEKTVSGFTVEGAPEGVTVTLKDGKTATATGTDAGTYKMGLTGDDFTVAGADNYEVTIEYVDGSLTINPAPATPEQPATPQQPGNSGTGDKSANGDQPAATPATPAVPKTGDETASAAPVALAGASLIALAGAFLLKRRNGEQE